MLLAGRNSGPRLVWRWWRSGRISDDQLRLLLPEAWTGAEFPTIQLSLRSWNMLFSATGFLSDDASITAPTEPLHVYRGCLPDYRFGMSWTTDLAQAQWFARRIRVLSMPGVAYEVDADPRIVLARFVDGRREAEVVLQAGLRKRGYSAVPILCPSQRAPPAASGS